MAEHDLNKIVDDAGEVFNLRDSTKQPTADRVTAWGSTPSDTKYPSEKLVKDSLDKTIHLTNNPSDISNGASSSANSEILWQFSLPYFAPSGNNGIYILMYDVTAWYDGSHENYDGFAIFSGTFYVVKNTGYGEPVLAEISLKVSGKTARTVYLYSSTKLARPQIISRIENGVRKYYAAIYYGSSLYGKNAGLLGTWKWATSVVPNGFIGEVVSYSTYPAGELYFDLEIDSSYFIDANTAVKLATSRTFQTNLGSTSTASFNGTANVTPGVTGTLAPGNGGTGKTSLKAAEYNLTTGKSEISDTTSGDDRVVFELASPSESNGVTRGFRKLSTIWTWIKGLLSSESGVNISGSSASCTGNAATATAFSSGTAKTKFDGIAEGATKVEASTTNGKVKINGTDTTVYTHPSQTAYTSKGTATKVPQITTDSTGHVTGITEVTISGVTPASHTHGNIQNGGALQTNDITISSGDKLVVTDSSDSNKVARASVSFDGSTTTKALTQKGTFETFLTSHQDISGKMATDCSNKASGALQNLTSQLTEGTDAFTDGTEVFSSYASDSGFASTGHVNQPYRRKASAMWSYIKSKLGISSGKGGSDTPVYFNSDGQATTCNEMLRKNGGNATDTCMNALLMALPTNWTATPTDDTYLVRRDTGGAQSFGQVKFSTVWSYIYNKLFYVKNPADSSQTTHKRIQLGYASVGGSNVGFCCYLVHIFFNLVEGNLKGCGVTALVTFDWRASESRLAKLCIVNDNGMSAAGYNIVLANFLTDSGANLHITIGLVKKSASTTLVQFSYSYCRIVPISNGLNWTHSVASDTVGTYDYLIQGTYEDAGNADSVDGYHIQVGSYSSRTDTISLY